MGAEVESTVSQKAELGAGGAKPVNMCPSVFGWQIAILVTLHTIPQRTLLLGIVSPICFT